MWYVYPEEHINASEYAAKSIGSFFILLNQLVPLALIINIEIAKIAYSFYMEADAEFINPQTNDGLSIQNMNIHEELGQINYILCDKTGTLTQNELVFKGLIANGKEYLGQSRKILSKFSSDELLNFTRCILLCHDAFLMGD